MHYSYFFTLLIASYFLGSLNGAHIVARFLYRKDVSTIGTKNAGAGNMFRSFGLRAGFAAGIVDFTKGAVPVLIGSWLNLSPSAILFGGAATIAGHNWPLFFRFRGGRGTATLLGFVSAFLPQTMLGIALIILPFSLFPASGLIPFLTVGALGYLRLPEEEMTFFLGLLAILAVIFARLIQTEWNDLKNSPDKLLAILNILFTNRAKTEAKNRMHAFTHFFKPKFLNRKHEKP